MNIPGNPFEFSGFDEERLIAVLGIVLIISALILIYRVVSYVLESVAMYTIAKRRGIKHPVLAWIPVANFWLIGCISDQYRYVSKGQVKNRRSIMLAFSIAPYVLSLIGSLFQNGDGSFTALIIVLEVGIGLANMILWYVCLFDLYASCDPSSGGLFLVLSILLGFTRPFLMFASRKNDLGMPPRRGVVREDPDALPKWEFDSREVQWQDGNANTDRKPEWESADTRKEPWETGEE